MNLPHHAEIEREAEAILKPLGYQTWRVLPDGRIAFLHRLMFTCSLCLANDPGTLRAGYDNRWCYANTTLAELALQEWDTFQTAEPPGWHRHPTSGRRRPGGDPSKEYIAK